MKRLAAAAATLAVSGLLVAQTAFAGTPRGATIASAGAPAGVQQHAVLTAFDCHRALNPDDRSVSVTAVMRPLAGTRHMAVKFDLLMMAGGALVPVRVHAGDLGLWRPPANPTLGQLPADVWNLQKSVVQLAAPATYRFRVQFRWTGDGGKPLGIAVRYSPRCRQLELRPDLIVQSITVSPVAGNPNLDLYTAAIANQGNTGAGPFEVLFATADGSTYRTRTVQFLPAHARVDESFYGPVCSSATAPTVTADSTQEVDDLNRVNNALTAICPSSPPS